jgi:hypothetical protein
MPTNSQPKKANNTGGDARKLEGEGSYSATRRYNENLADELKKGRTEQGAEEARKAMEGPEGEELKRAAEQAKRGPKRN